MEVRHPANAKPAAANAANPPASAAVLLLLLLLLAPGRVQAHSTRNPTGPEPFGGGQKPGGRSTVSTEWGTEWCTELSTERCTKCGGGALRWRAPPLEYPVGALGSFDQPDGAGLPEGHLMMSISSQLQ